MIRAALLPLALAILPGMAAEYRLKGSETQKPWGAMTAHHGVLEVSGLRTPPGRMALPYVRYASGKPRPALFFLGGGPGLSNLGYRPPEALVRDFDVVVLEYRGVGRCSYRLRSRHFAKALRKLTGDLSLPGPEALRAGYRRAFEDLAAQGVAFDEFDVFALAGDLEGLRQSLGYARVHLLAHSFGTRVALAYQTRHRDQVAGSVCFALNMPGGFIWRPSLVQGVWRRYQQAVAQRDPALGAELKGLLEGDRDLPGRWGPFPINQAKARFTCFVLSFNPGTQARVFGGLLAARTGRGFQWFMADQACDWFVRFGFNWADFFLKAYTSDAHGPWIQAADAEGPGTLFQSPSSVLFSGHEAFAAAGGRPLADRWTPDLQRTLAVAGEFDPSTPLETLPAELPLRYRVVLPNRGHADPLYGDPQGVTRLVRRFLLEGVVDPSGFCLAPLMLPVFDTRGVAP